MLKGSKYRLLGWLLLFGASVAVLAYLLFRGSYSWLIVVVPVLLVSVYRIFRLFSENIRKMTFMFNSIANGDYSFQFTEYDGTLADNLLNMTLNRIRDIMLQEKTDVIRKEQYYSLILNSVNTGILVINENGSVYQTNDEAVRLFGLPVLTHIRQLASIDEAISIVLNDMQAGEKQQLCFFNERGEVTLSVRCSSIVLKGNELRIFALSEIGSELAEQEIQSWIRLIRVLTHEIMNSITPITSLSETLMDLDESHSPEMRSGLETIHATGKGLTAFVESYRQLTRVPAPRPVLIPLEPFLQRAVHLVREEFPGVGVTVSVPDADLILHADENLIFQVLTNLLKNAAQALDGQPDGMIHVAAECPAGEQIAISVTDNGSGIPGDVLSHIFIPFFTTKEHGSGIGLSLSRQIMRLHNGQLSVRSRPGETVFTLLFP